MKKAAAVIFLCGLLAACSQNSRKEGDSPASSSRAGVPAAPMTSDNASANAPVNPASNIKPVSGDTLLPEVEEKYKGVILTVVKRADNSTSSVEVPFGSVVQIDSTPLSVEAKSYFPNFIMSDTLVINQSMEEKNPGAKVRIDKNGKTVFDGWLFQNFPGTHGFEDSEYDVFLSGAALK